MITNPFRRRTSRPEFEVGQVWHYRTRTVEPESTLVIGRIEPGSRGNTIHLSVRDLRIANPNAAGGIAETIAHLALDEESLSRSVTELTGRGTPDEQFESGYAEWLEGTEGEGAFSITVAEAVATVEALLSGGLGRAT